METVKMEKNPQTRMVTWCVLLSFFQNPANPHGYEVSKWKRVSNVISGICVPKKEVNTVCHTALFLAKVFRSNQWA